MFRTFLAIGLAVVVMFVALGPAPAQAGGPSYGFGYNGGTGYRPIYGQNPYFRNNSFYRPYFRPIQRPVFTPYRVMRGDTVFSIARRFGTSPQQIARINGLANPNFIVPGQRLFVPFRQFRYGY